MTPCHIINNEVGKKCFGSLEAAAFKELFFLRYLSTPKYSESKRLAYELLTVYLAENPIVSADSLFALPADQDRYLKWLLMNQPEIHARLLSYRQLAS